MATGSALFVIQKGASLSCLWLLYLEKTQSIHEAVALLLCESLGFSHLFRVYKTELEENSNKGVILPKQDVSNEDTRSTMRLVFLMKNGIFQLSIHYFEK